MWIKNNWGTSKAMLNFNTKRKRWKHTEHCIGNEKLWHQGQMKNLKVNIEMFDQKNEKHKIPCKMFN